MYMIFQNHGVFAQIGMERKEVVQFCANVFHGTWTAPYFFSTYCALLNSIVEVIGSKLNRFEKRKNQVF